MIGSPMKIGIVAAMGLVLLVGQGCSMKWLQSDGETEQVHKGVRREGYGFSQNPSEERWGRAAIVSLSL